MRALSLALGLMVLAGGCGLDDRAGDAGGATTSTTSTTSTSTPSTDGGAGTATPRATTTTIVAGIVIADIGTVITTEAGNTVVVRTVELPLDVDHPDPDLVYAAIDVEVCAGADARNAGVRPAFFQLETGREAAWLSVEPVREPALHDVDLAPGRCAGGWVTFSIPKGLRPTLATMQTRSTKAAWRVA